MPPKFGAVKRANLVRDADSFKRNINIYIVSESSDGNLVASSNSLKKNLKSWLSSHKMINDTVDILNANIINFGVQFEVVAELEANKYEVLDQCSRALQTRMKLAHYDIGEPIRTGDMYRILRNVRGVMDVIKAEINIKTGTNYSSYYLDLNVSKSPDNRLIYAPENGIFELKFPGTDIIGTVL